jgi:hypothetical protein
MRCHVSRKTIVRVCAEVFVKEVVRRWKKQMLPSPDPSKSEKIVPLAVAVEKTAVLSRKKLPAE